jgi:hypothetical protein
MHRYPGNGTAACHDHIHAKRRHVCATRELAVATSGSHNLRRRPNCNLCACSFPPCATRPPSRGRACPTLLGSAAICTEGTASRPPTARRLADIGWVAPTSFCDVCDLMAVGLECTGTPGTALRSAMTTYMPNRGTHAIFRRDGSSLPIGYPSGTGSRPTPLTIRLDDRRPHKPVPAPPGAREKTLDKLCLI